MRHSDPTEFTSACGGSLAPPGLRAEPAGANERPPGTRPRPGLRIAVLGAGLAGLSAARRLRAEGHTLLVFDKGRKAGGRLASRHAGRFDFDAGAQFFTVRDARFEAEVRAWSAAGVVAPWHGRIVTLGAGGSIRESGARVRFVGTPSMSAIPRHLSVGLELESGTRIRAAERRNGRWFLGDELGAERGPFDALVVAVPLPQALELFGQRPRMLQAAAPVRFQACWAVQLGLAETYPVRFDGAFVEGAELAWVARNSSKPERPAGESWVLHATPAWSETNLEAASDTVVDALARALERTTTVPLPKFQVLRAHLWRYAQADPDLQAGSLFDADALLAFAGDWCNGSRVEGAYLSGLDAAERLLAHVGSGPLASATRAG